MEEETRSKKNPELEKIKKIYGEVFMQYCRTNFPTILEKRGELTEILNRVLATNSRLIVEILKSKGSMDDFNYLIKNEFNKKFPNKTIEANSKKTPQELLEEKGYDLVECTNEEEIQSIKRKGYYEPGEELCTFNGGRTETCVCFWAIKKNWRDIKRKDFRGHEAKEDEYGTSVLAIQFKKDGDHDVEIITRYNHGEGCHIDNPNCTLDNNLDNLVPGLEKSFVTLLRKRGYDCLAKSDRTTEVRGLTRANDGKYYKYNCVIDGRYYCPGNIVIDNGEVEERKESLEDELIGKESTDGKSTKDESIEDKTSKDKRTDKVILADYFIIDQEKHRITLADKKLPHDSFLDGLKDIKDIKIVKDGKGGKDVYVTLNGQEGVALIQIDKDNQIVGYENPNLKEIGNSFLRFNTKLRNLKIPNVTQIGNDFLKNNTELKEVDLPNVIRIGNNFLEHDGRLESIKIDNLEIGGNNFASHNTSLREIRAPKLKKVGINFFSAQTTLETAIFESLEEVGLGFFSSDMGLKEFKAPNLRKAGDYFLENSSLIRELEFPNLISAGKNFCYAANCLAKFIAPNLTELGESSFTDTSLERIDLPKLERIGNESFNGEYLREIDAPNLVEVGEDSFVNISELRSLNCPKLEKFGKDFLKICKSVDKFSLPKTTEKMLKRERHIKRSVSNDNRTDADIFEEAYDSSLTKEGLLKRYTWKYIFSNLKNKINLNVKKQPTHDDIGEIK